MIRKRNLDSNLVSWISNEVAGGGVDPIAMGKLMAQRDSASTAKSNVYYVCGTSGNDAFDGLSPEKPFLTIDHARTIVNARINWSNSPWARSDTIVIFPGTYAENLTSLPYGSIIVGLGQAIDGNGEYGVKIKPASGAPVDCTSIINTLIQNIWFESPDASVVFQTGTFNRAVLKDCFLQGLPGASNTTTIGFETETDVTGSALINVMTNQCSTGFKFAVTGGNQFTGCILDGLFAAACETAGINVTAGCTTSATIIKNSVFGSKSTTCAAPFIDADGSPILTVVDCHFFGTTLDPATGSGYYSHCYHNGTLVA